MPRVKKMIPRAGLEVEVLDSNLRLCLATGRGFFDTCGLTTKLEWLRAWKRHGAVLLEEFIRDRPGTRPTAMRCAGLLEPRRLAKPLPTTHGFVTATVLDETTGAEIVHLSGLCMYAYCEADQLLNEGAIDAEEHRRHFEEGTHDSACAGVRLRPDRGDVA